MVDCSEKDTFHGFTSSDFSILGSGTIDDYSYFHYGIEKFMCLIHDAVKPSIAFRRNMFRVGQLNSNSPVTFSSICFYDEGTNRRMTYYPNINFLFTNQDMQLSVNGETTHSFRMIYKNVTDHPVKFEHIAYNLGDYYFTFWNKLQYRRLNNFIWNPIYVIRKRMNTISVDEIIEARNIVERKWSYIKDELINQIKSGHQRHSSGRAFNDYEIEYAHKFNNHPHYAIRIERIYPVADVVEMDKHEIITLFANEIARLAECLRFVLL